MSIVLFYIKKNRMTILRDQNPFHSKDLKERQLMIEIDFKMHHPNK